MFVYAVDANVNYATHATPNTEDAYLALRQGSNVEFKLQSIQAGGKGAALTALTGISHRGKRWTTAGSGGTAITPAPRDSRTPAAATTAADKQTALTPGTVSGAIQLGFTHGAAGPGAWVARDEISKICIPSGTADELTFYSHSGVTAMLFTASCEIEE